MRDLGYLVANSRIHSWIEQSDLREGVPIFVRWLREHHYSDRAIAQYRNIVAHFAHWLTRQHIGASRIDENLARQFVSQHLSRCRCDRVCQRTAVVAHAGLFLMIKTLRSRGLVGPEPLSEPAAIAQELRQFKHYLSEACGLAHWTQYSRCRHVRAFLLDRFGQRPIRVCRLKRADITDFMSRYTANCKPSSRNDVSNSMRSYLRYKESRGEPTAMLSAALPHAVQYRQTTLPKTLSASQIKRLLGAFDRHTSIGKRNYAIARCFTDLGLRNIEVTCLRLDDVNWKEGTVRIRGKSRRIDVLPLPVSTGEALTDYLQNARPATTARQLFVRSCAPYERPLTSMGLRNNILYAAERCGLKEQIGGTHIFRHTLAQQLLREGASLKEIADMLCHRSLNTTARYAKIDERALAQVALPWAGRRV